MEGAWDRPLAERRRETCNHPKQRTENHMSMSSGSAKWEGGIKDGHGSMKPTHASEAMFSLSSRFEGQAGSNPEELIGAALSGCFSMALAGALSKANLTPTSIRTSADVQLDKDG